MSPQSALPLVHRGYQFQLLEYQWRLLQFMTEATSMMLPAIEDGVLPFHAVLWNSDSTHNHRRIL